MIVTGHAGPRHIREGTGSPDLLGMHAQTFSLAAIKIAGASRKGQERGLRKSECFVFRTWSGLGKKKRLRDRGLQKSIELVR
jgi:hypothetical protein